MNISKYSIFLIILLTTTISFCQKSEIVADDISNTGLEKSVYKKLRIWLKIYMKKHQMSV